MKSLKVLIFTLLFCGILQECNAQSQAGNPTNAFWDGVNLPMAQVSPGVYALYGGDINQDGTVDGLDMNSIEVDASVFAFGYNVTDITGDGATDGLDMNIVEINSNLFLFIAQP